MIVIVIKLSTFSGELLSLDQVEKLYLCCKKENMVLILIMNRILFEILISIQMGCYFCISENTNNNTDTGCHEMLSVSSLAEQQLIFFLFCTCKLLPSEEIIRQMHQII